MRDAQAAGSNVTLVFSGNIRKFQVDEPRFIGFLSVSENGEVDGIARVSDLSVVSSDDMATADIAGNILVNKLGATPNKLFRAEGGEVTATLQKVEDVTLSGKKGLSGKIEVKGTLTLEHPEGETAENVIFEGVFYPSSYLKKAISFLGNPEDERRRFAFVIPFDELPKEAASGLYGHTRRVQADCEACIRKMQRTAKSIAKRIYGKDQRVSQFLSTHAKRANSLSAEILITGMEALGPKFAATDARQAKLSDADAQSDKGVEETKKEAKIAGVPEHGLYGFPDKTATLGLNACAELRAAAGRVATDLHRRRADRHGAITGFLKEHCAQTQCKYAQILSDSYPDHGTKTASTPRTVADWVALDL